MKMSNEMDKRFVKSVGTGYIDLSSLVCQMYIPMIKIYTKHSSFQSKLRYYDKIKDSLAVKKPKDLSLFGNEYDLFLDMA